VRKARLLRDTPFFVNGCDGAELVDKQQIFLVLAGLKPVAEVASNHQETFAAVRKTVADDPRAVGAFLESLDLACAVWPAPHFNATMAAVALTPGLVKAYRKALMRDDPLPIGRLLGYPETAVRAFAENHSVPIMEQEQFEQQEDVEWPFVPFRFSHDHWRDEAEVARKWYAILRQYDLG
jgi:hypothetical protein